MKNGFNLPAAHNLTNDDIDYVCKKLIKYVKS
jgi:hypothetical protein